MKHDHSTYSNHGCRCEVCCAAKARYNAAASLRRRSEPTPAHVHGTDNGYTNYWCRCERCRRAHTDYARGRREARR